MWPSEAKTDEGVPDGMLDRLARWSTQQPEALAAVMLDDDGNHSDAITYAELDRRSGECAAVLLAAAVPGAPVFLPAEPTTAFVVAMIGCLRAGMIAVPAPASARHHALERLQGIVADAGAHLAISSGPASALLVGRLDGLQWVSPSGSTAAASTAKAAAAPARAPAPALLQYTSGSTGDPKGVVLTNGNLAADLALLECQLHAGPESRVLTWLPLYHDMGLIAHMMMALYCGGQFYAMNPTAFVHRPQRWLASIARERITISGSPNFGFALCVERHSRRPFEPLRLDHWQAAVCGAEPVHFATLRRFAETFASMGFNRSALMPSYGLAEATVFVTGGPVGSGLVTLPELGGDGDADRRQLVGCGKAPSTLRIVDPETCRSVPEGQEGEIWLSGDIVAAGYWGRADNEAFGARLHSDHDEPETGFLRTGDLGLVRQGQLFVTGRLKDLIIYRGSNIHPEDVERTVLSADPRFGAMLACFAVDGDAGDDLVVLCEHGRGIGTAEECSAMSKIAIRALADHHGIRASEIRLVRSGTIPRTTSGKVRRAAAREAYVQGRLPALHS